MHWPVTRGLETLQAGMRTAMHSWLQLPVLDFPPGIPGRGKRGPSSPRGLLRGCRLPPAAGGSDGHGALPARPILPWSVPRARSPRSSLLQCICNWGSWPPESKRAAHARPCIHTDRGYARSPLCCCERRLPQKGSIRSQLFLFTQQRRTQERQKHFPLQESWPRRCGSWPAGPLAPEVVYRPVSPYADHSGDICPEPQPGSAFPELQLLGRALAPGSGRGQEKEKEKEAGCNGMEIPAGSVQRGPVGSSVGN